MPDGNGAGGVEGHWGNVWIRAWGGSTLLVLAVIAIIASNVYQGYTMSQTILRENKLRSDEHVVIAQSHDLMTCVLTMSLEDRDTFRREYRPGYELTWCPWIKSRSLP